jgi:hypothetical protein
MLATHLQVLLDFAMDVENEGQQNAVKRATIFVCMEEQLGKLRHLLDE